MSGQVATTLAYVRTTGGGVVAVLPGDRVPDDAVPGEVDRLAEAGALTSESTKEATVEEVLAEVGEDQGKASAALEAEQARGEKARKTLVEKLQTIAAGPGD